MKHWVGSMYLLYSWKFVKTLYKSIWRTPCTNKLCLIDIVLAFHVFGAAGKMAIEVSMIGFLGGTCIAFFVVMGDLAPPIIAGHLGIDNSEKLRIGVLLGKYLVKLNIAW